MTSGHKYGGRVEKPAEQEGVAEVQSTSRRERRRQETHERITGAAFELFAQRGFYATTVEEITNLADVGKGTFFNYFPSKEHILIEFSNAHVEKTRAAIQQSDQAGLPVYSVLQRIAQMCTEDFGDNPALARSLLVPVLSAEAPRSSLAENFRRERGYIAEFMESRQATGELRADIPPVELARRYQEALFGVTLMWSLDPIMPLKDCLKDMVEVMIAGMCGLTATPNVQKRSCKK